MPFGALPACDDVSGFSVASMNTRSGLVTHPASVLVQTFSDSASRVSPVRFRWDLIHSAYDREQ